MVSLFFHAFLKNCKNQKIKKLGESMEEHGSTYKARKKAWKSTEGKNLKKWYFHEAWKNHGKAWYIQSKKL